MNPEKNYMWYFLDKSTNTKKIIVAKSFVEFEKTMEKNGYSMFDYELLDKILIVENTVEKK